MFELIPLTRSERNMLKEFDRDFYRMEKDFRREEKEIASMLCFIIPASLKKKIAFFCRRSCPAFARKKFLSTSRTAA